MVLMKECVEICLLYKWCTKLFEVVLTELKHYITASTCSYRSFICEDIALPDPLLLCFLHCIYDL